MILRKIHCYIEGHNKNTSLSQKPEQMLLKSQLGSLNYTLSHAGSQDKYITAQLDR